jgi:AraC-like DNA-binding protein
MFRRELLQARLQGHGDQRAREAQPARHLQETGVKFRDLLDDELKRRADRLLHSAKLSRSEIAERLGYDDPTSFSRACRRWFPRAAR